MMYGDFGEINEGTYNNIHTGKKLSNISKTELQTKKITRKMRRIVNDREVPMYPSGGRKRDDYCKLIKKVYYTPLGQKEEQFFAYIN